MYVRKLWLRFALLSLIIFMGLFLVLSSTVQAVVLPASGYWINLPPYNTLWPLWAPPLSPINPLTGLPTPIVSELKPSTVLPVQPGLTWDPSMDYPWLLYNTPIGMAYYDPFYGVDTWPPSYLINPITRLPAPIDLSLILGWSALSPTSSTWLLANLPIANNAFINSYPAYAVAYETLAGGTLANLPLIAALVNPPPPLQSLLTPSLLLGLGTIVP